MNFEAAAEETFQILRSYDYEVLLFDEEHSQVFEPNEGRRFFAKPENLLVSIVDDGEDSAVRLYLSKSTSPQSVLGLIGALRSMATKYKMLFHVRKYDRDLSPKDFATQASVSESKNNKYEAIHMNIVEGMYGTSRSSYLKLENARMIVRHSAKINENILGARGRNIDAIYIENALGERHLFATTQLAPARAMAHHVDNGGTWADPVGEQIGRMATDFANMGAAVRHINFYGNDIAESAQNVRATLRETLRSMRRVFEGFGRKTRYSECMEALSEMAAQPLVEGEGDQEKIAEFATMLNTEAVQLSESVLGIVARVMEDAYNLPKMGRDREVPTVTVLGKPVSAEAWAAFKAGKLDLMVKPDLSKLANYPTPGQKVLYAFTSVAKSVKDNSMANFLSHVSELLRDGGKADRDALSRIVSQTMRAAGLVSATKPEAASEVASGSSAIREFDSWVGGHAVAAIMEYDRFMEPDYGSENRAEDAIGQIVADFDYDRFMTSSSARDFHYEMLSRLDADEKEVSAEAVVSAIEHYLTLELDDAGVQTLHPRAEAEHLARTVITHMQEDGYTVTGADEVSGQDALHSYELPMAAEDVDLDAGDEFADEFEENCGACDGDELLDETDEDIITREDVLLPRDEGDDLLSQVSTATVVDPASGEEKIPDDGYINRLMSLSGQRR